VLHWRRVDIGGDHRMRSECDNLHGRPLDLCLGVGRDGRPNPSQDASDRYRAHMGLDPIGVRNPSTRIKSEKSRTVSQVGSRLSALFKSRIGAIPCGNCKSAIGTLNTMTTLEIRSHREFIIEQIETNSLTAQTAWWAKVLAYADSVVTGGMASRAMIGMWIDEAIAAEEAANAAVEQG